MNYSDLTDFYNETVNLLRYGPESLDEEDEYIIAMGMDLNAREFWDYEDYINNFEDIYYPILEEENEQEYENLLEELLKIRDNITNVKNRNILDWYYECKQYPKLKNQGLLTKEKLVDIAKKCKIPKAKTMSSEKLIKAIEDELQNNYLLSLSENDIKKIFPTKDR